MVLTEGIFATPVLNLISLGPPTIDTRHVGPVETYWLCKRPIVTELRAECAVKIISNNRLPNGTPNLEGITTGHRVWIETPFTACQTAGGISIYPVDR